MSQAPASTRRVTRHSSRVSDVGISSLATPSTAHSFVGITPSPSATIAQLLRRNAELEAQNTLLQVREQTANAHAVYMAQQAAVYKYRLNHQAKKQDGEDRRIHTQSRVITSVEGREEAAQEKQRKQRDKVDSEKKGKEKEKEDILRRGKQKETQDCFTGALTTNNKSQLEDICAALEIPYDGTVKVLQIRLKAHFDANPELKQHERYKGLFSRGNKRATRSFELDENGASASGLSSVQPPSNRPRLET
ncbi:hypothetical protein E1B28_003464 [Marasmius oreades]|uniref:Uncharacterized protein n=1 Tax=Marasmius oreades TaxID=181124 RepID=A0A9P7RN35_9AGAR|nr:uncharacterized protein E1B28_003464 [Marasmius oreades]KAG7085933.1 hypothetical protein E1B28_003464 [Marasmius oreades]